MIKTCTMKMLAPALLLLGAQAQAITWGQPDGMRHPEVAALVDTDRQGTLYAFCTGTLISPTVVLTAAHCNPGVAEVNVTFESQVQQHSRLYRGRYIAHPNYRPAQNDPHDIAVIVLAQPITDIVPARLPTAGLFDTLKENHLLEGSQYTAVGYGGQERNFPGSGAPQIEYRDGREWAVSTFGALNAAWLRLSQNNATGNGGTCFGDSGGPNFIGSGEREGNVIAGTTITGDTQCVQSNVIYRLDTQAARDFLMPFVILP